MRYVKQYSCIAEDLMSMSLEGMRKKVILRIYKRMALFIVLLLFCLLGGCGKMNRSVLYCEEGERSTTNGVETVETTTINDAGLAETTTVNDAGLAGTTTVNGVATAGTTTIANGIENAEYTTEASGVMKESTDIYIHVCGSVKDPGLYSLSSNARIGDAVEAAGGFTKDADQSSVNLAGFLEDGTQIYVYSKEEVALIGTGQSNINYSKPASMESSSNGSLDQNTADDKVNLNTADVTTLTSLNGIGDAKAQAIIEYRQTHGTFASIEEITQVDGIGDGIYQKIKDHIVVK